MLDHAGMLDRLAGVRVILNEHHPDHPTKVVPYTVRFECHPHIRRLLQWLKIPTYVEGHYTKPDVRDPFYIADGHLIGFTPQPALIIGPKNYARLKEQLKTRT